MSWLMIGIGGLAIAALSFYAIRAAIRIWSGASHAFRRSWPVAFGEATVCLQQLLADAHDGGFVLQPTQDRPVTEFLPEDCSNFM